ncbi:unnamed protein product, partial [Allacma fusca]
QRRQEATINIDYISDFGDANRLIRIATFLNWMHRLRIFNEPEIASNDGYVITVTRVARRGDKIRTTVKINGQIRKRPSIPIATFREISGVFGIRRP